MWGQQIHNRLQSVMARLETWDMPAPCGTLRGRVF